MPTKIVLVHNGVLKTNIRPTFEGFISREFKDGEFEHWDIYHLTDLFGKHLFSEYLLSDEKSNRLLKKTLAFLDSPDNDYSDFKKLILFQLDKVYDVKSRAFVKLFTTLGLLNTLVFHYSKENEYLIPAKECSKFLVLKTWNWILKNKLDNKKAVVSEFKKILNGQYEIFNEYFKKTFKVAKIPNGLFAENGAFYEKIGYPIRCFEYLDDIIYYCRLRNCLFDSKNQTKLKDLQKDYIIELIENNSGFYRPILDNHSIPIIQLFLFFAESNLRQKDVTFIHNYITTIIDNLAIEKIRHKRQPELYNNLDLVIEAFAMGTKPDEYCDSSSVLIAILLELCVIFDAEKLFNSILSFIDENLSLQVVSIDFENYNVEELLFDKNLHSEYHVECIERGQSRLKHLKKESDFDDFKKSVRGKIDSIPEFSTDKIGLSCIRYLAHSFYKNEILPFEWRQYIQN